VADIIADTTKSDRTIKLDPALKRLFESTSTTEKET